MTGNGETGQETAVSDDRRSPEDSGAVNDGGIDLCCSFMARSCQFSTLATLAFALHQ